MRLSEAIWLGRVLIKRMEYGVTGKCALNAGLLAIGNQYAEDFNEAEVIWPWLREKRVFALPCGEREITAFWAIIHLFDGHVMKRYYRCKAQHGMTLEQLVDWIRSVEPEEAEAVRVESPRNEDEVFGQATPDSKLASANLKNK